MQPTNKMSAAGVRFAARAIFPLALLLTACGPSPEMVVVPDEAPPADGDYVEEPAVEADIRQADPEQSQLRPWHCRGTTYRERLYGRLGRQVGVEGFASQQCQSPAVFDE